MVALQLAGAESTLFLINKKRDSSFMITNKCQVSHFYVYDDNSDDNVLEVLQPYIERGIVTYVSNSYHFFLLEYIFLKFFFYFLLYTLLYF